MAPRKLSDSDKRQITSIYCQPGETTSTLADKFGISSSTVSRVLKQMLPDDEYSKLMKWKRSGERGSFPLASSDVVDQIEAQAAEDEAPAESVAAAPDQPEAEPEPQVDEDKKDERSPTREMPVRRSRRRSNANTAEEQDEAIAAEDPPEKASEAAASATSSELREDDSETVSKPKPVLKQRSAPTTAPSDDEEDSEVAAWVSEGLEDAADYDEDSDEDWDEEDWDDESEEDEIKPQTASREAELTILSFDDNFSSTKPCYLVVDRMAELITCPLKDFSELGMIPPGEEQARTLPVFDNHRIARRFARRNQRIIKVPDGVMLNKTQDYLHAKGITRILFDGQVYALSH